MKCLSSKDPKAFRRFYGSKSWMWEVDEASNTVCCICHLLIRTQRRTVVVTESVALGCVFTRMVLGQLNTQDSHATSSTAAFSPEVGQRICGTSNLEFITPHLQHPPPTSCDAVGLDSLPAGSDSSLHSMQPTLPCQTAPTSGLEFSYWRSLAGALVRHADVQRSGNRIWRAMTSCAS